MLIPLLRQAAEKKLIRALDVQFAGLLADESQSALMLAAAWVSAEAGAGHVCLPLALISQSALFAGREPQLASAIWQAVEVPDDWQTLLLDSKAVSDGSRATPLVLYQQRLYLNRMWQAEGKVAAFITRDPAIELAQSHLIRSVLDQLFGQQPEDWQKIAAAVALTRKISVISGGPGTGKTTTVAKLLAALLRLSPNTLRIQLAAPTGKAAARLTESLGKVLPTLSLSAGEQQKFPKEATTLHRLLGAQFGSQRMRYHAGNPLHLDVLVVDEASMVDLPMMATLIAALPKQARVIFLGDRDQLASVEAGAVLGDICRCAEAGYSTERAQQLMQLTGCHVDGRDDDCSPVVRDSLCLLRKSYRFDQKSGIGQLAQVVNAGDVRVTSALFGSGFSDIEHHPLANPKEYQQLLNEGVAGYRPYLQQVAQRASPLCVMAAFARYQWLCALSEGAFGVVGLNERLEQVLQQQGLIQRLPTTSSKWYAGRPVMITRNDRVLGLYNGDIGIALWDEQDSLKIFFQLAEGSIKAVHPSRLPPHNTAFVMTVHKSQGSEFDRTVLVLPNRFLPLLTRELLYTAITRARTHFTLYADINIWNRAVKIRTERRSGLQARL